MSKFADFAHEAREMNRRIFFLWLATGVSAASLLLATEAGRWVWAAVLLLCLVGLLAARHSFVRLAGRITDLPLSQQAEARELLRGGRFLLIRR